MAGLFDAIGGIAKKGMGLLEDPHVQGIGTALAFGANPLLGLLGGTIIKNSRERRQLENDAMREEITAARRSNTAKERLPNLLNDVVPTDRLLDVEGGAPSMIDKARPGGSMPLTATRAGQAELQGLLADMAPGVAAQGLMQQPANAQPSSIQEKVGLFQRWFADGVPEKPDPTQMAQLEFLGMTPGSIDPNVAALASTNASIARLREMDMQAAQQAAERADAAQVIRAEAGLTKAGKRVKQVVGNLEDLSGTFLQPGVPGGELRRDALSVWNAMRAVMTNRQPKTTEQVTAFDEFKKNTSGLLIDLASTLTGDGNGFGTFTNDKLQLLRDSMANDSVSPEASLGIMSGVAADLLTEERLLRLRNPNFRMPNREFLIMLAGNGDPGQMEAIERESEQAGGVDLPLGGSASDYEIIPGQR